MSRRSIYLDRDLHAQLRQKAANEDDKLYNVADRLVNNGLKLENRWPELSLSTTEELKKHGITLL